MEQSSDASQPSTKRLKTSCSNKTGRRKAACQQCRLRKSKCSGTRPVCALCAATESDCVYLVDDNDPLTLNSLADIVTGRLDGLSGKIDRLESSTFAHIQQLLHNHRDGPSNAFLGQSIAGLALPNEHRSSLTQAHLEPARDYSHIPPHRASADTVLTWPIFDNQFAANYLVEPLLGADTNVDTSLGSMDSDTQIFQSFDQHAPLNEQQIPNLVDKFLENVHTKNPILDVELLVKKSREASSKGLRWDAHSCLLLMVCALGIVAKPFGTQGRAHDDDVSLELARRIAAPSREREQAENCFIQASRRLGALKPTVLGCQCYFFAGVYLMYTLRPMLSWQYFHQASILYQLYLKMNGRITVDHMIVSSRPALYDHKAKRQHRLEQRLYWSCFKSEAEFRVELPLPQSELADYEHPDLFPSPPSPAIVDEQWISTPGGSPSLDRQHTPAASLSRMLSNEQNEDIRQHAKRLCSEEESWYYYLTEVALRRIGNRVINTFFTREKHEWMKIDKLLDVATEFEAQVSTWQTNLPSAMQKYETNSTIRAPRLTSPGGAEASFVSRELSWATENRLLEMRSWLYQPFLYYLVHARPPIPRFPPTADQVTREEIEYVPPKQILDGTQDLFWTFVMKAIDCNLTILDTRSIPHRHHGLWFDLRAIICATLILLAVVKSGYIALIPGGRDTLIGHEKSQVSSIDLDCMVQGFNNMSSRARIGGKFGKVLRQLEIWSHESPDMVRSRTTLVMLIEQVLPG